MGNNLKKIFLNENFCFFLLFCFALLVSFFYFYTIDQRAINSALILSNEIVYENKFNILNITHHNTWTLTFHLLKFLINLGINLNLLNFLILFICLSMSTFGIFLISKALSGSIFFSFFISCLIILGNINFGNLDYPVLLISEHTNGMSSQACAILVFGLIADKKISFAILLSIITLGIHIIIGAWLISILFLSIYTFKQRDFKINFFIKKKIYYLITIFVILILSFSHFQLNKIDVPYAYDYSLYTTYLEVWDHHRSKIFGINYNYIFLTVLMLSALLYFLRDNKRKKNNNFLIKIIILQVLISFIIYFLYKIFPNLFQGIFLKIIPSRFFLIHSVFGVAIILSILYYYTHVLFKNKNILALAFIIIMIHPIVYHNKYFNKFERIYNNSILANKNIDYIFWNQIKKIDVSNGVILTSNNACSKTFQDALKPILICIESIDVIPYRPELAKPIKNILEKIYEVNFSNPPEKNHGGIWYDRTYKDTFEKRTYDQWKVISKEFDLKGLILPVEWNLQLNKSFIGKKFTYYAL